MAPTPCIKAGMGVWSGVRWSEDWKEGNCLVGVDHPTFVGKFRVQLDHTD
jgi:hypothetical protein